MVFEKSANEAKQEVAVCEKEIGAIKTKLRALGATTSEETGNLLKVSWLKVRAVFASLSLSVCVCVCVCVITMFVRRA